ncbi:MAG: LptA/OstA family protein [Alphaproteobacteria bacterium]
MSRSVGFWSLTSACVLIGGTALAQQAGSPFVGFSASRDKPIAFEADRAEVFDADRRAVLSGNVRVRQGESLMATRKLTIHYEGNNSPAQGARPANPVRGGQGQSQNVRYMEMDGGVLVSSKDQHATAERGTFDSRLNVATLIGSVVLTQCQNVIRGERMVADLNTNRVRVEGSAASAGRVSGLLNPQNNSSGSACATPPTVVPHGSPATGTAVPRANRS